MPENAGKNQGVRDELGRFVPGVSGNPEGKPKGTLSFATKFNQAIEKLAETNQISGDELELQIVQMAIKKAREGDYQFYRDVMDRVYGRPVQTTELTGRDGGAIKYEKIEQLSDEQLQELIQKYEKN